MKLIIAITIKKFDLNSKLRMIITIVVTIIRLGLVL
jgi:hypothetical protein